MAIMFQLPTQVKRTLRKWNYVGEDYTSMVNTVDAEGVMTVTVLYNGLPIAGALVFLYLMEGGELLDRKPTDSAGKVVFTHLDSTSLGAGAYFVVTRVGTQLNLQVLGRL